MVLTTSSTWSTLYSVDQVEDLWKDGTFMVGFNVFKALIPETLDQIGEIGERW